MGQDSLKTVMIVVGMDGHLEPVTPFGGQRIQRDYDESGTVSTSLEQRQSDKQTNQLIQRISDAFETGSLQDHFNEKVERHIKALSRDISTFAKHIIDRGAEVIVVDSEKLDEADAQLVDVMERHSNLEFLVSGAYLNGNVIAVKNNLSDAGQNARVVSDLVITTIPSRDEEGPGHQEAAILSQLAQDEVYRTLEKSDNWDTYKQFIYDHSARSKVRYGDMLQEGWYEKIDAIDEIELLEHQSHKKVAVYTEDVLKDLDRRPKPQADIYKFPSAD